MFGGSWEPEERKEQHSSVSRGDTVQAVSPASKNKGLSARQNKQSRKDRRGKIQNSGEKANGVDVLRCLENLAVGDTCSDVADITQTPHKIWKMLSFEEDNEKELETHQLVVAVAATTVPHTKHRNKSKESPSESSSGEEHPSACNNFVGVVHRIASEEDLTWEGKRVAGFTCNCSFDRFVKVSTKYLLPVPQNLDATEVATVLATYLPAFQALYHGVLRSSRYSRRNLENQNVFIRGGDLPVAQAAAHLASLAGARHVYLTAPDKADRVLKRLPATVLPQRSKWWPIDLQGRIHTLIDFEFPVEFNEAHDLLRKRGRIVCIKSSEMQGWLSEIDTIFDYYQLLSVKRAALYDFSQSMNNNFKQMKEDFEYLLKLLSLRQLRPFIDSFVHLEDVEKTQAAMKNGVLMRGTVVCEPWKKTK